MPRLLRSAALLAPPLVLAACVPAVAPVRPSVPPAPRRAILVSFDSFSPERLARTLPAEAIPTFRRLFGANACVAARPAFPSVTAPGHAALWTGAYGDVNGIAANEQPRLPRADHALTDLTSGYSNAPLRAEPLWIAAARQGRTVVGHHVTQAPGAPGYPAVDAAEEPAMAARRAEAAAALARPEARVLNGYNRTVAPAAVLNERTHPLRPARTDGPRGWAGTEAVPRTRRPFLEAAWKAGEDSVFALFTGSTDYERVYVGFERNLATAVRADAHAEETALPHGRALARYFSAPLAHPVPGGRVFLRARLFRLAADASAYTLFVPAMQVVEANRPDVAAAYDDAVQGWTGNGAYGLVGRGFGPSLQDGGDGTAERRYLESAELAAETSLRGTRWAWAQQPDVLLDYFALGDEVDHQFYGWTAPERPGFDPALAARMNALRAHVWALADRKLALLDSLARSTPGTLLVVAGDHGMRATWREFRPNAALAAAGLLRLDAEGRIDLPQSDALSPSGYFVSVNTTGRPGGRVDPARKEAVLAHAEAALLALRDETGTQVVARTWRAGAPDALGTGGPVGGDLYYELAPGYYWNRAATGAAAGPGRVFANHGFPAPAGDMQTGLCLVGAPAPAGAARIVDAAPTIADWLGLDPPRDAIGRAVLRR